MHNEDEFSGIDQEHLTIYSEKFHCFSRNFIREKKHNKLQTKLVYNRSDCLGNAGREVADLILEK